MQVIDRTPKLMIALAACEAFADLPDEVGDLVFSSCEHRSYAAGEPLMRQGEPGDCLMVLTEGRATAFLDDDRERPLAAFERSDIVGEMALLTREPRSATVVADDEVHALALGAEDFQRIAMDYPVLGSVLTHIVAERLGQASVDGMTGKTADRYRIERCLGRGGMAIVYKARDLDEQRDVALKMMSHRLIYEPGALARFKREANVLLSLEHENIARVFRRFSAYRTHFIAMELIDGVELAAALQSLGPLPEEHVRGLLGQLASALAYLHGRGVLHRDLKPSNLMLTRDGRLKLTDFGLAKPEPEPSETAVTVGRTLLGTPLYMAPEQLRGDPAGPAADVYGFGCVAFELLTGAPMFSSTSLYALLDEKRAFTLPARIGSGASEEMRELIGRCVDPEPAGRVADLASIAEWSAPVPLELP